MNNTAPGTVAGRVTSHVGCDPDVLIEKVRTTFVAFAKKRAFVEQLEHGRKVVLAEEIERERTVARQAGDKATEARLDNLARMSQGYRDFLKTILQAKYDLAELEAEHFSWRNKWELCVEQVRFARSEMYNLEK